MVFGLWPLQTLAVFQPADITIIELKMTGSESLVIQNTTNSSLNLGNYLVEYFNKAVPASLVVPTDSQLLPSFTLGAKQSFLLSGDSAATCGAAGVANLSMSLSDSAGYVQVVKTTVQTDGSTLSTAQDHVSWTSASSGADITKVPSATTAPNAVWYRKISDGSWQQAELSDCTPLVSIISPSADTTYVQWSEADEPLATIISLGSNGSSGASLPVADIGLAAPQITELMPNPAEPQTDSEDEFIEIYNPNDKAFDLTGFKVEVGTTTKRSYAFASGTIIAPKVFKAFYLDETGLSLSNNGSQARLLDPFGSVINQSETYGKTKEGQSWALANGKWYWTTTATPGAANVIKEPAGSSKTTSTNGSSRGAVKGAQTTAAGSGDADNLASGSQSKLHPLVLAGLGAGAIAYAAYEYRSDLANRFYQFKRYRESRRTARTAVEETDGSGT